MTQDQHSDEPASAPAQAVGRRPRRRLWTVLGGFALAIGLGATWAVLKLPDWLREQGQTQLSQLLGRPVSIERVELGLFPIRARVQGLRIMEADGSAPGFSLGELSTQVDAGSLIKRHPVINELKIVKPELHLVRFADGRTNIDDVVRKLQARPKSDGVPPFYIANVELSQGAIRVDDRVAGARHAIEELQLDLPFLSSLPADQQVWVKPALRLKLDGHPIVARGETLPFEGSNKSRLSLEIADLDLAPWLVYWPRTVAVVPTRGRLSTRLQVDFEQGAQTRLVVDGTLALREAGLQQNAPSEALERLDLQIGEASIERFQLQALARKFTASGLRLVKPDLKLMRPAAAPALAQGGSQTAPPATPVAAPAGAPATTPRAPAPAPKDSPASTTAGADPAASAPFDWQLGEVLVTQGRVSYEDPAFQPKALKLVLAELEGKVQGLGADPGQKVQVQAQARGERGEALGIDARFARDPAQRSDLEWRLDKVSLTDWWWLIEPHLISTPKGGALASQGRVSFGGGKEVSLDKARLSLGALQLRSRSGIDWFKLASLQIDDVSLDAQARQVRLGRINTQSLSLLARRGAEGEISLLEVLPVPGKDTASARPTGPARPAEPVKAARPARTKEPASPAPAPPPERPWRLQVGDLQVAGSQVELIDTQRARDTDIKLADIRLQARDLSFEAGTPLSGKPRESVRAGSLSLNARLNSAGQIALKGPLQLQPLRAQFEVEARAIDILPFQSYFTQRLNALVTQGEVEAQGRLDLDLGSGNPVSYAGSVGLQRFASVTKAANDDLLKWRSLRLSRMAFALEPFKLDLGDIDLEDFYARLIISPQGRFNLQDLAAAPGPEQAAGGMATPAQTPAQGPTQMQSAAQPQAPATRPAPAQPAPAVQQQALGEGPTAVPQAAPAAPPAAAAAAQPPANPLPVRIGRITLARGQIDFSDFFVKPNYSAKLTDMSGEIGELTPERAGAVRLSGRVDGTGTLAIEGQINPLIRNLFLELKANATDIDLPRLSPYSGKYVGYGIEKGKLSAKVSYRVENRQLQAENNIILDQLTFGEKVDSPTALKLPIQFAVSLLKDRNGVIDVNLPIGGSLDAPDFSISGLVMRMIGNLIVKVITSPFTFLASLAGGPQQELSTLAFDNGQAALTAPTLERLQTLAKVLADRPGLKLDMGGRADPIEDAPLLRKQAFERLLKAQKVRESVRGNVATDLEAVTLTAEEYPRYLTLAYQRASFDKARNLVGMQKALPIPEMEKLLNDNLKIGDAELLNLANRRAQAAKDWLAESGKISTDRLFITAPRLEGKARVDLSLK